MTDSRPLSHRLRRRWKKFRKWRKRNLQHLRRYLVYILTKRVGQFMVLFPPAWTRAWGAMLGRLAYSLAGKERKKVRDHLCLAYGDELNESRRQAIARSMFEQAGRTAAEWCYMQAGQAETILRDVRVEGLEHFEAVLARDRGILFLTAHFGNWELMTPLMVQYMSREVGVVARELSNPWVNAATNRTRESHGAYVFPRGSTGRDYIRFLRKKNGLAILGDIDTGKGAGLFVPFFNQPAWTQSGIARLAYIGRAEVLPAFIFREPENPNRHVVRVFPAIEVDRDQGEEGYIREMTAAFTKAIEKAVRMQPDQWMWIHRRWLRQPDPQNPSRPVKAAHS